MTTVRLYGNGAAAFHYGKEVIRAVNGVLDVPAMLVPQALALGFSHQPPPSEEEPVSVAVAPATPPIVDGRLALYEKEARDLGYTDDVIAAIVGERIRYDDLIAEGMSEEEATAAVWGPKTGDTEFQKALALRTELDAIDRETDPRIAPPVIPNDVTTTDVTDAKE